MELEELKEAARRVRAALAPMGAQVSHGQALDLVSALPGLRNWPEVSAFPVQVQAAVVCDESVARLARRVESRYAVQLDFARLDLQDLKRRAASVGGTKKSIVLTELHTRRVPGLFRQFKDLVGESHWTERTRKIDAEIRGAPFMRELLNEENALARQLTRCSAYANQYGEGLWPSINDHSLFPAFRFMAQITTFARALSADQRRQIVGRTQGAFKNPEDLRALQFELAMATHFAKRGHEVMFPEMFGGGTFDLLIADLGPNGLEVECKSASTNKGRKIHRREALEFFSGLQPTLDPFARHLQSGLYAVITIPERLPTDLGKRAALHESVVRGIIRGNTGEVDGGVLLRIADFDIHSYPELGPQLTEEVRASVDTITGTDNREVMILGRKNAGALIVVVQSAKEDRYLKRVLGTVQDAAKRQLTGSRPGLLIVGLDGISGSGLVEAAKQDQNETDSPTALRVAASRFLNRQDFPHVVGVGFTSEDSLEPSADGVRSGGMAYYFPRKDGAMWDDAFSGLFV